MARLCVTIPDSTERTIKLEADQAGGKSEWVCSAIDHYLRTRDQKPDQLSDQERRALEDQIRDLRGLEDEIKKLSAELQAITVSYATMEERVRGQAAVIDELRARAVHAEGVVQELTSRIPMITDGTRKPAWWQWWKRAGGSE